MPTGILQYPTSLDTAVSLGEIANNASCQLSAGINAGNLTVSITEPAEFATTGWATLTDSLTAPTKTEIVRVDNKVASALTIVRAQQGTTAQSFSAGHFIETRPTARHVTVLQDAIIQLETKLGIGSATAANNQALLGTAAGTTGFDAISNRYIASNPNFKQLQQYHANGGFGTGASPASLALRAADFEQVTLLSLDASPKIYEGGVSDGRYLYLVPSEVGNGQIARFDTSKDYDDATAWTFFSLMTINAAYAFYRGAVYDGKRYIYFVPSGKDATAHGNFIRYDTWASFTAAASYTAFNLTGVSALCVGYNNAVFDGRYIWLAPFRNAVDYHGNIVRYDTEASFTAAGSYATFNLATIDGSATGFYGGVFDGTYVYLIPNVTAGATFHGKAVRVDKSGDPTVAGTYTVFDLTTVNASGKGFRGGVYDGRYVYFVPNQKNSEVGVVVRYDTKASTGFSSVASYVAFDMATINASAVGFYGAAFDGLYIYYIPMSKPPNAGNGLLVRYDTTKAISDTSAYSTLDLATLDAVNGMGFEGAYFDGKHIYVLPGEENDGYTVRFPGYAGGQNIPASVRRLATTSEFFIDQSGRIGVGTNAPAGGIDLVTASTSSIRITNTTADATNKDGIVAVRHYLNSEEDVCLLRCNPKVASSNVEYGGGPGSLNAVTGINFYTAANNTTLGGSLRLQITSTGNMVLGSGAADASAVRAFGIVNGTAPASSPADLFQLWCADWNGAGTAAPHLRNEENNVYIFGSTFTVPAKLKVGTGVVEGGGLKHVRITTGSIGAGASALVTVTWGTAFADANYTVVVSVEDSTAAVAALAIVHVETKSASAVAVRVQNTSAGSLTGTLHVIAIHD